PDCPLMAPHGAALPRGASLTQACLNRRLGPVALAGPLGGRSPRHRASFESASAVVFLVPCLARSLSCAFPVLRPLCLLGRWRLELMGRVPKDPGGGPQGTVDGRHGLRGARLSPLAQERWKPCQGPITGRAATGCMGGEASHLPCRRPIRAS